MWSDPSTGARFFIDSRTGHSYCQLEYTPEHVEASTLNRHDRLTFTLPKIDSLTRKDPNARPGLVPAWLDHAFKVTLFYPLFSCSEPADLKSTEEPGICLD